MCIHDGEMEIERTGVDTNEIPDHLRKKMEVDDVSLYKFIKFTFTSIIVVHNNHQRRLQNKNCVFF